MAESVRQPKRTEFSLREDIPNRDAFITFSKTIATAGNPAIIHADKSIPDGYSLVVKGKKGNTGNVLIGESVSNLKYVMGPNEFISLRIANANLVFIDVTVNGEGVDCIVEQ